MAPPTRHEDRNRLEDGDYAQLEHRWVVGLSAAAVALAVATFVVIIVAQF